jgi:hypothetical protein
MTPDNTIRLFFLALLVVVALAWVAMGEHTYPEMEPK